MCMKVFTSAALLYANYFCPGLVLAIVPCMVLYLLINTATVNIVLYDFSLRFLDK
jgi:hypothetical protein